MAKGFVPSAEDVDKQALDEFLDEARDLMSGVEVALGNIRSKSANPSDATGEVKRLTLSLRGQAKAVNHAVISMLAIRMDDYLSNVEILTPEQSEDVQVYADKIMGVLDGDITISEVDGGASLVRELPMKRILDNDFEVGPPQDVDVVVIVPEKAMARILERELAACGIRSTNVRNPFEAFEQVVRVKPDMVICSMELGALSGVDLASAFSAMPKTATIPFALFTSYDWGHAALEGLPPRAALLRKGKEFSEDIATALARFKIL